MQLHYYIKAPINELNTELPELKALESNAWFLTSYKASYKINDIMEILSVLHEEQKNKPSRFDLIEDEESLFWEMLMLFKEKIIKIKL